VRTISTDGPFPVAVTLVDLIDVPRLPGRPTTLSTPSSGRTIGDYGAIVNRHRWLLTTVTALGLAAGAGYSVLAPNQYESQTSVLVQPTGAEDGAVSLGRTRTEINLDTEAQLVKSTQVASLAAEQLGETELSTAELAGQVRVTVPPNTSILSIGFVATEPRDAQAGAEAFAEAYLEHRAASANARLSDQADATESELASLRTEREDLATELDSLSKNSSRYTALRTDRDILDNQIADLTTAHSQLRTAAESVASGRIISEAAVPTASNSPHHLVSLIGGALVGLLLGLCVIAARMRFAVRVWHPVDLPRRCGVDVLAALPGRLETKTTDVFGAFGAAGRVFGKLRHEVVAALGATPRVIVVAGVAAGSASSVVAANLAAALARAGDTTTAVATHPNGGRVTLVSLLGTLAVPGLADVFSGRVDLDTAVHPAARQPNLTVIGPGGSASAAGLSHETVTRLSDRLRDRASYVIIDAAPMAVSSDAQLLASIADGVLLTVECGHDRIDQVAEAVQAVERVGAPLLGAVVLPSGVLPKGAEPEVPRLDARPALTQHASPRLRPHTDTDEADDRPTEVMPAIGEDDPNASGDSTADRGADTAADASRS